jgi:hypothetical protein
LNPHVIEFLIGTNPAAVEALRRKYPSAQDLLTVSATLGDSQDTESEIAKVPVRELLRDLANATVNEMTPKIEEVIEKKVNAAKFFGAVLTTAGGAITATMPAIGVLDTAATAIVGIVTMLSGLAVIFADRFEQAPSGVKIASIEEHAKLIEARSGVDRMKRRLKRDGADPIPETDLRTMLDDLDKLSATLVRLIFSGA